MNKLSKACQRFAELSKEALNPPALNAKINPSLVSNKPKIDPPKQRDIKLWSDTLVSAVRAAGSMIPNVSAARNLFSEIAPFREHSGIIEPPNLREIGSIKTAIELAEEKLRGYNIDPVALLRQRGVQNIDINSLNRLKKNIDTIFNGKDFSQYQQYTVVIPGVVNDIIELDQPAPAPDAVAYNDPGY